MLSCSSLRKTLVPFAVAWLCFSIRLLASIRITTHFTNNSTILIICRFLHRQHQNQLVLLDSEIPPLHFPLHTWLWLTCGLNLCVTASGTSSLFLQLLQIAGMLCFLHTTNQYRFFISVLVSSESLSAVNSIKQSTSSSFMSCLTVYGDDNKCIQRCSIKHCLHY